jgi:prolyl-tRNA synthetase
MSDAGKKEGGQQPKGGKKVKVPQGPGKGKEVKKVTKLGIQAKKAEDFSTWYTQVVVQAEMIDYYEISGCYILRPWSYSIWEQIQSFFDKSIKKSGVKNTYFPLFIPKKALELEKEHVEGFAAEVAWVTRSGKSELEEPIAIRPTSETIMYPAFSNWIKSHRDLPLRINQWSNVVRWEFKCPTPFIRTREFLWQEGHSAYATLPEAEEEVLEILDLYAQVYEDLLCIPVVKGKKTENEKFAGGLYTTTVEAFVPTTGRGIQGATSHCLGQNFAKMFDITFEGEDEADGKKGGKKMVWQNSWGLTTRTIGVMVMVHGDDKGLKLPPRIAPIQVILVPVYYKEKEALTAECKALEATLIAAGIRCEGDYRYNYNPPWKYNHYELKGVPLRMELGPRNVEAREAVLVRRDTGEKITVSWDGLGAAVATLLVEIQRSMLETAREEHSRCMVESKDWTTFIEALSGKKMALAPWCGGMACEQRIKDKSGEDSVFNAAQDGNEDGKDSGEKLTGNAKSLCTPFAQPELPAGTTCVHPHCGKPAINWTLFGRSY